MHRHREEPPLNLIDQSHPVAYLGLILARRGSPSLFSMPPLNDARKASNILSFSAILNGVSRFPPHSQRSGLIMLASQQPWLNLAFTLLPDSCCSWFLSRVSMGETAAVAGSNDRHKSGVACFLGDRFTTHWISVSCH